MVEELGRLAAMPEMRELLHQEAAALQASQAGKSQREREQLKQVLASFEERFERWAHAFSSGAMTGEQFGQYNRTLLAEKQEASQRLAQLEAQSTSQVNQQQQIQEIHRALADLPVIWEHLDFDEKRQVLLLLLEKVTADREDRLIRLKIKVQLLPQREVVIPYRNHRGKNRSEADPVTLLTKRELSILHYLSLGLSQVQVAQKLGLKKDSIWVMTKAIRKKCGRRSTSEVIELARERIAAVLPYLPLEAKVKASAAGCGGGDLPYISGVLMEVFPLFAHGASVMEVARRLKLSPVTVQGRWARILKLMGTSSMLEAVERAQMMGLLKV